MDFDLPYTEQVDYEGLLDHARKNYDSFTLVWRAGMKFSEKAEAIKKELAPFLIEESRRNAWPGTESSGEPSIVSEYRVSKQSVEVLSRAPSVWAWKFPNFPEDLAFYRNGKVMFASVAHEQMAWHEKA